jgi:hypothetical protein
VAFDLGGGLAFQLAEREREEWFFFDVPHDLRCER